MRNLSTSIPAEIWLCLNDYNLRVDTQLPVRPRKNDVLTLDRLQWRDHEIYELARYIETLPIELQPLNGIKIEGLVQNYRDAVIGFMEKTDWTVRSVRIAPSRLIVIAEHRIDIFD